MKPPLCISTLDLGFFRHGGVTTKAVVFAKIAEEEGFAPFFLTPSVALHRTVKRTLSGSRPSAHELIQIEGYPCHQFGALFPELENNAHRFEQDALRRVLPSQVPCFAVSGNNHAARPFHDLGMEFSIWPGATFWEDCRHRIAQSAWSIRKCLDLATKSACERLERTLFEKSKLIAADTLYTQHHVAGIVPAAANKMTVIPVPVDCDAYIPASNPTRRHLVFIGRLSDPRKNISLLLEAFLRSGKDLDELQLVLIGSGDPQTSHLIASHPFAPRIRWLQGISQPEKIAWIQQALALVIPSSQEGYGIVGTEALACGTPVISTPCGGTSDFVIDGENGFMMKTFNADEMAEAIGKLWRVSGLAQKLSKQAREFALAKLSLHAVGPKLKAFIHGRIG